MLYPGPQQLYTTDVDTQLQQFIEQKRYTISRSLDGLTELESRMKLVPSKTTLLGLVKHAIYVEKLWFQEARIGSEKPHQNIANGPDESFELTKEDSISSVLQQFEVACQESRSAVQATPGSEIWPGHNRGPLSVYWILLHVLQEHAQHCGHIDILREQILATR